MVSGSTLRSELNTIAQHKTLACYLDVLDPTNYASGAGGDSINAAGAAAWANLRVEGLAINQYVTTSLKYVPDASELATAKSSLEGEMTEAASAAGKNCSGTSSEALGQMTSEMRQAEIEAQATSLYLVAKVKKAIPLTTASMKSYYTKHTSQYDTLCISVAVVAASDVSAFAQAQSAGASVATLAKEFSEDASGAKGGAYGCYTPSESSYTSIRADVAGLKADTFATTPISISYDGTTAALYVAVTKRTVTPYASAAQLVLSDLKNLNASSASEVKNDLLYTAAVHVDPAFGRWGLSEASGLGVFAPASPAKGAVTGATQLSATGSPSYK
jgi:hypothetical protein